MKISNEHIVKIVTAGGGVIVDASSKGVDQLEKIAAAATVSDATVIFKNVESKGVDHLVKIAKAGARHVIFDLT